MKSRPENTSPSVLRDRSVLPRAKTIGDNYTEDRIKERIQGRGNRKRQMQTSRRGISLISDIQERIQLIGSKGYEHKAKLTILKEAARTLNYLTENNLLQYADLERKSRTFTAPMPAPAVS